jgi:hypothetical protein
MSDGINSPFVNIDELHRQQQDKLERRYAIYEKILKLCHNRIKQVATNPDNMGFCFYNIPPYVYGVPLYDTKSCIMYVVKSLVSNGFDVKYTHPNLLWISWLGKTNDHSEIVLKPSITQALQSYPTSTSIVSSVINESKPSIPLPSFEHIQQTSYSSRNSNQNSRSPNSDGISEIDRKILNIIKN